ncbi:hypothetical protein [Solimonas flava]|uniref:hypothetical protein n=1 Tax=Solimonas flava TaxID=415849 RepID=UPI0012B6494D|nr:hypothetical protein [Solimonas flava]
MSFDLYFIAYEQTPPSAAMAEEIRMVEEEIPRPAFDAERTAVITDLKGIYPQYVFSPSENGEQFGGLLSCESCDLPDVNFWPSHAMVEMGFRIDPEWSQKTLVSIANTFERHHFAIYDPENEKIWTAAQLASWLQGAVAEEQRMVKEIQEGGVEFKETEDGVIEYKIRSKRPWWRLW